MQRPSAFLFSHPPIRAIRGQMHLTADHADLRGQERRWGAAPRGDFGGRVHFSFPIRANPRNPRSNAFNRGLRGFYADKKGPAALLPGRRRGRVHFSFPIRANPRNPRSNALLPRITRIYADKKGLRRCSPGRRRGRVYFSLPIRGNLHNPRFRLGHRRFLHRVTHPAPPFDVHQRSASNGGWRP
jgi:hypothetical protein